MIKNTNKDNIQKNLSVVINKNFLRMNIVRCFDSDLEREPQWDMYKTNLPDSDEKQNVETNNPID